MIPNLEYLQIEVTEAFENFTIADEPMIEF